MVFIARKNLSIIKLNFESNVNNSKQQTAKDKLVTAKKLQDTSAVITQIKEILHDRPRFIPGWIELGLTYRKIGDRHAALSAFEAVLKHNSNHKKARLELSTEQLFLDKVEDCRKNLEQLIKIAPKNGRAFIKLGKVYQRENNELEALKLFKKALQIDPTLKEASLNAATQLQKLERIDEAVEHLEKALDRSPNCHRLQTKIGELERERQRFDVALTYFQQAIAIDSEHLRSHFCLIDALWHLRRFDEAEEHLKFLYDKYPDDFSVALRCGQLARKLNHQKEALQWFRIARSKAANPNQNLRAVISEIGELKALGCLDEALKRIDSLAIQFPEDLSIQMMKGNILQALVDLPEAAKVYRHILSIDTHHLNCRIELAKVYSQLGRVEQAIHLLEDTNRLVGTNVKTFIQLGSLNQALENYHLAESWYRKACLEYPQHPQGYCKLANLLFLQGDAETAIELLQNVRAELPHNPQPAVELIRLQIRLGNFEASDRLISSEINRFPHDTAFTWQLYELRIKQGEYAAALNILDRISTENRGEIKKIERFRANIYFLQYDLEKAEEHIRNAIALTSFAVSERIRLANILLLTGRVDEAYQELKIATEKRTLKVPPGRSLFPLKCFSAVVVNLLRIHPPMLNKLIEAEQKYGSEKILAFGNLLNEEPNYFGSALYLARELRKQGIFDRLQQTLSISPTNIPQIPKRIVQFWDEPELPLSVQRICQSWSDRNPEYEYQLFSLDTAVSFFKENYGAKVMEAFANCQHPAIQSDFFRLAYLNKMGGFYADADDLCRQSLDSLIDLKPELIVFQEQEVSFGNNFLGCISGQTMIRAAFEKAVANLTNYSRETPWTTTGPALITSVVCSALVPYLSTNYPMWPRLLVLTTAQFKQIVNYHMALPYKKTDRSWSNQAYNQKIKALSSGSAR